MSFLHEPGDLARTPLAAILLEALNLRASGLLEVEHGGGTSKLWIANGRPVGAQVVAGFRPLGQLLLQAGLIDIVALSTSLGRMAETGRSQGEILVEMGAVTRADVDRMLAEQQAGYFAQIAALDAGAFRFDPAIPVPEWTRGSKLSPLRTIVDALERPQAGALVVSALQPIATGGVRLASGYAEVEPAFRWTDAERALVSRLLRVASLEGFFAGTEVPPERSRAIIAALLLLGLAVPAEDRPTPTGETSAGLDVDLDAAEPPSQYAVAPAVTPAPLPGEPGRRSDPAEARARRQRLLQQAMRNIGVGPFGGTRPTIPAAPAPGAGGAPPAAEAAPGSPEAQLRAALLAIAPRARERDLFARLGVPDGASVAEVKRAFLALARQFHPDRFGAPALRDVADTVRDFFTAVNEAYEVLADEKKRAEYLAARRQAFSAQAEAARIDFQKGEACIRTRDFARARGFLEAAVRGDPRPEHLAALAHACLADPQRRDRERARALLEEATRDTTCDRASYTAGLLARDEGDDAKAERWFRAAAHANPRNADAIRELRALEGRRAERRGR